jgi:hypothetical protein
VLLFIKALKRKKTAKGGNEIRSFFKNVLLFARINYKNPIKKSIANVAVYCKLFENNANNAKPFVVLRSVYRQKLKNNYTLRCKFTFQHK